MICRDIYEGALACLGEDPSGEHSEDYAARSPYLLAALCFLLGETDRCYRAERGLEAQKSLPDRKIELSAAFPLCKEFAPAAVYYLASMLIFDTDSDRSDTLFEKYYMAAKSVIGTIVFESKKIIDKYPL